MRIKLNANILGTPALAEQDNVVCKVLMGKKMCICSCDKHSTCTIAITVCSVTTTHFLHYIPQGSCRC